MKTQKTLQSVLRTVNRSDLVADIANLIEEEILSKRGLRGLAIKKSYSLALKIRKGLDKKAIHYLLDDSIEALEPYYAAFHEGTGNDLSIYFAENDINIAASLLEVVDTKASILKNEFLSKIYGRFRNGIESEVVLTIPKLGKIITTYE